MHNLHTSNTIAAIATAKAAGSIGIVRLSGPRSLEIAKAICGEGDFESHRVYLRNFIDPKSGDAIDKGLLLHMQGPNSFTGEDVVELQGHGGIVVMREILRVAISLGARLSLPGEFSMRAYQNGKIDLTQAESISALISARSATEAKIAQRQLSGHLSQSLQSVKSQLIEIAAILEAWVDFPEEGLEFTSTEQLIADLEGIITKFCRYVASYEDGQKLKEGLCVCLVGLPNVGKSSLLNALLGRDRAIVHSIAGTTRDALEEDLTLGEVPLRLVDTAGIRKSNDPIECEGIQRSYQNMQDADLVLFVTECQKEQLQPEEEDILFQLDPSKTLLVRNKADLSAELLDHAGGVSETLKEFTSVYVSAKQKEGLDAIKDFVQTKFEQSLSLSEDSDILVHLRHKDALQRSLELLKDVIEGMRQESSAELVAADMKEALYALEEMMGGNLKEDILDAIFSKFCIGK